MDKLDKDYLNKIVEKTIEQHDGKTPRHQLDSSHLQSWDGINIQGHMLTKPSAEEKTLALYMIDTDKRTVKRFTVTKTILFLLSRETAGICYGTTGLDGHQFRVVLQWEKEIRE